MHRYSGTLNNLTTRWDEKIRIKSFYECSKRVHENSDVQTYADREAQQEQLCTKSVQQYEKFHAKDGHFRRRCNNDDQQDSEKTQESILKGFLQTLFHSRFSDQLSPTKNSDDRQLWVISRHCISEHLDGRTRPEADVQLQLNAEK